MGKRITIHDVKQALLDERFREKLPDDLKDKVRDFLKNPNCVCNHPIYLEVLRKARKQLLEYFPTKDEPSQMEIENQMEKLSRNDWEVINCTIYELESRLKKLKPGRKQIEMARFQDQVTVIVNHLEEVY